MKDNRYITKHSFRSNGECTHAFFYQKPDETGAPSNSGYSSTVSFDRHRFHSYSAEIGSLHRNPSAKTKRVLILNQYYRSYSNTTAGHYSNLHRSAPVDVPSYFLPSNVYNALDGCYTWTKDDINRAWDRYKKYITQLGENKNCYKTSDAVYETLWQVEQFNRFAKLLGKGCSALVGSVRTTIDTYYSTKAVNGVRCKSFNDYVKLTRERNRRLAQLRSARARMNEAIKNVTRFNKTLSACEIDELAKFVFERLGEHAQFADGSRWFAYYSALRDRLDSSYAKNGTYWQISSVLRSVRYPLVQEEHGFDRLYVVWKSDEKQVHTSRYVTLTGESVRVVGIMLRKVLDGTSIVGKHIGPYVVFAQDDQKIQVGCHKFSMDEVRRFKDEFAMTKEEHDAACADADAVVRPICDELVAKIDKMLGEEAIAGRVQRIREEYAEQIKAAEAEVADYLEAGKAAKKKLAAERRAERAAKKAAEAKKTSARKKAA